MKSQANFPLLTRGQVLFLIPLLNPFCLLSRPGRQAIITAAFVDDILSLVRVLAFAVALGVLLEDHLWYRFSSMSFSRWAASVNLSSVWNHSSLGPWGCP